MKIPSAAYAKNCSDFLFFIVISEIDAKTLPQILPIFLGKCFLFYSFIIPLLFPHNPQILPDLECCQQFKLRPRIRKITVQELSQNLHAVIDGIPVAEHCGSRSLNAALMQ